VGRFRLPEASASAIGMQATCAAARRAHDRMDENARAHSLRARDRGHSRIAAFTDAINCTAHKTGRQL